MRRRLALVGAAVAAALLLQLADVRLAASQTTTVVARFAPEVPADDPWDPLWSRVRPADLPLSAQLLVPPKGGTRDRVSVRALHDRRSLFVLLEWADPTEDARIDGVNAYSDAAALQFPAGSGTAVPPLCMGSPTAIVNIWQWKAAWQVEGARDTARIRTAHPRAAVDLYPFGDDPLFAPARQLGNLVAQAEPASPVEALRAGQYGTLTPASAQDVGGSGTWRQGAWRVLFRRSLGTPAEGDTTFAVGGSVDAAAAVWDGASRERDGMKAVSAFFALRLTDAPVPTEQLPLFPWLLLWPLLSAALVAMLYALGRYVTRRR